MSTHSIAALVGAVLALAIGVAVFLRDRKRSVNVHFATFCCGLCLWQTAVFFSGVLRKDFFFWLALAAAIPLPWLALNFFQRFLSEDPRHSTVPNRSLGIATVIAIGVMTYSILVHPLHQLPFFGWAVGAYVISGFALSLRAIRQRYHATRAPAERLRLLYLLLGAAASLASMVFPPIGATITFAYLYFVSQSLFRYRLLDLNELLGRMVVLAVQVLTLASLYGLLLAWVRPGQAGLFFFNTVIASFVVLILSEPLRLLLEDRVNRWLFRQRFELRLRVENLRRVLASVIDLGELVREVLRELERSSRVTHAAIYLIDRQGAGYDLTGCVGPRPEERLDVVTRRPFFERLRRDGLVAYETLQRERLELGGNDAAAAEIEEVQRTMDAILANLCLPLLAERHVLGLLCLRDERLREAYSTAEIDILRGLAAQISITLQNSQAYEQMRERERLAALGVMAAGLAHEIRNPLGAIKGAAQLIDPQQLRTRVTEGSNEEFLGVIIEEVNRLNRVVSQFLDYARPERGQREAIDVNDEVRKSTQLLQTESGAERVEIGLELEAGLPPVRVDSEQMRQVFLNLGLNAIQAMGERGGKLTLTTRLQRGARRGEPASFLQVSVRDNGPGIASDVLKNIFNPFFTTKEKGTGLGLAICQRIVENHGGAITVRSQPGTGTTFTVLLPLGEEAASRTSPPSREKPV